jgi:cytochrome oxidase Cu insertion factor (SCO1/SenC/PrrC family)
MNQAPLLFQRVAVGVWAHLLVAACAAAAGLPAAAQPLQATASERAAETLRGRALDGRSYDLGGRRGRVVMVVLWRTDCGVCLSKMPELRANALGWKDKPFDLVTLSVDPQRTDTESYDRTRRLVAAAEGPVWSFWQGDVQWSGAWLAGARLPVTLIFDREGVLQARHEGRVPADVWDSVADLLP